jgi:hypothetical protein
LTNPTASISVPILKGLVAKARKTEISGEGLDQLK